MRGRDAQRSGPMNHDLEHGSTGNPARFGNRSEGELRDVLVGEDSRFAIDGDLTAVAPGECDEIVRRVRSESDSLLSRIGYRMAMDPEIDETKIFRGRWELASGIRRPLCRHGRNHRSSPPPSPGNGGKVRPRHSEIGRS